MFHPLMKNNITDKDLAGVAELCLQKDAQLTQGPNVEKFEKSWSEWLGVKYSTFVNSGASANFITLEILRELHGGGEVILSPLNWISDVSAVVRSGFQPVFVDVDPTTLSIDNKLATRAITDKTVAILVTHIQGFCGLTEELTEVCANRGIAILEDVCESHGAQMGSRKCGSIGLISNFSFYYAHHISTIEGGMICTNDENIYELSRMFRSHGMVREVKNPDIRESLNSAHPDLSPKFIFNVAGFNMRNTEVGGLIGLSQIKKLDSNNKARTENFHHFLKQLDPKKYYVDFNTVGCSNYSFTLVLKEKDEKLRDRLEQTLDAHGIEYRRGTACGGNHLRQPYLKKMIGELDPSMVPNIEHLHFFGYYLGNFPALEKHTIDKICQIVNDI